MAHDDVAPTAFKAALKTPLLRLQGAKALLSLRLKAARNGVISNSDMGQNGMASRLKDTLACGQATSE